MRCLYTTVLSSDKPGTDGLYQEQPPGYRCHILRGLRLHQLRLVTTRGALSVQAPPLSQFPQSPLRV
jgi:hypothetical protein